LNATALEQSNVQGMEYNGWVLGPLFGLR